MRFVGFSFAALAAAALASAAPQDSYGASAAPSYGSESVTTASTTYTSTRTVLRVTETVTATRNGTLSSYETTTSVAMAVPPPSATASLPGYGNGTSPMGTGAPSGYPSPAQQTGAAGRLDVQALGFAAAAGIAGLALF